MAQLAEIYRTVLTAMDPGVARSVHTGWATEPTSGWRLADEVSDFRTSAGITTARQEGLRVRAEPVAALLKGSDGPDWVVACVLMQVQATFRATAAVALGRCERMQWHGDRWMLASGSSPAPAPSTWPGTAAAAEAGWRPLVLGGPRTPPSPLEPLLRVNGRGLVEPSPRVDGANSTDPEAASSTIPDPVSSAVPRAAFSAGAESSADVSAGVIPQGPAAGPASVGFSIPNPLDELGKAVSGQAVDAWTSVMLAVWAGGLWVLRLVLSLADMFLTPDLTETGPGHNAYVFTFWLASALVVLLTLVQLGVAAFRRDGRSIATLLVGCAQFVLVWSCWLSYCVVVVSICGDLTHALMNAMLGVKTWQAWDPLPGLEASDVSDAAVATVLGLLGCVLWLAALGHLLVMLARAASLIVLVATGPIAAAGLVSDLGRTWFWKSLRWFHAAALTPLLMVLVLGIGTQLSLGVAQGLTDSAQAAVGTALPAVLLLCVSCVAPMTLFKMLAFVDPGTTSGASFRQGLAAQGGLQGMLRPSPGTSTAAAQTDGQGRSGGEGGAEEATGQRFNSGLQRSLGGLGRSGALGGVGQALATGMSAVQKAGALGTSLLADESNQAGVGHHTHGPDFSSLRPAAGSPQAPLPPQSHTSSAGEPEAGPGAGPGGTASGTTPAFPASFPPSFPPAPMVPGLAGASGPPASSGGSPSGATAVGGAAPTGATPPPVPPVAPVPV